VKLKSLVGLAAVLVSAGALAAVLDLSHVRETTLANGLHVIVKQEPYWGLAAAGLYVRAGSVQDPEGKAGVAHLVEHLLFESAAPRRLGLGRALEALGAYANAETLRDFSAVQILVASPHLARALQLLGEHVAKLEAEPAVVEAEKGVVRREQADRQEDGVAVLEDHLWQRAFRRHPYRWPIGGTEETLARITADDVVAFHRRFYVATNMALVVVGDITAEEVFAAARQYLAALPSRPVDWQPPADEPFPTEVRTHVLRYEDKAVLMALGFPAPSIAQPKDVCALDLIYTLLAEGPQAWLESELVRQRRVALGASCEFLTQRHPGLFIISLVTPPEQELAARQAVLEYLRQLREGEIAEEDLAAAKTRLAASYAFSNETYLDQVESIGFYEMIASYKFAFEYLDLVNSLSAEEVRAAARKYLNPDAYTLVILRPPRPGEEEAGLPWPWG
jgi:zinc protease